MVSTRESKISFFLSSSILLSQCVRSRLTKSSYSINQAERSRKNSKQKIGKEPHMPPKVVENVANIQKNITENVTSRDTKEQKSQDWRYFWRNYLS